MLNHAAAAAAKTRLEGRWLVRYLIGFALTAAVLIPPMAFLNRWPVALTLSLLWLIALSALFWQANRHHAITIGGLSRAGGAFMLFALAMGITCAFGFGPFAGQLAWWIPGGLVSAAPWLIAAIRESRR